MTNGVYQDSPDGFLTGTGRLVGGSPFTPNTLDFYGNPLKDGRVEFVVQVAFPKDQPQATRFNELWALMQQVAATHKNWATYAAANGNGFKFKLKDGDAPENAGKEGWKGCWVLTFKSGFPPQVFDINNSVIAPPAQGAANPLPRGHFVRLYISLKANDSAPPQSGLYLNFNMIQRVGYGPEIQSGPDFTSMLQGQQAAAALPGMSSVPTGPAASPMGSPSGVPGLPGGGAAPAGMPPAPGAAPGLPGAAPGMPAGAPTAPAVETPQSRMIATDFTYDGYIASGWNEDMLIQHGKMRPATVASAPATAPGMPAAPGPGLPPAPGALPPTGHPYNQ